MSTTSTNPRPVVPALHITLTGTSYGGQYWNPAEFEAVFEAHGSGEALTCHVDLRDTSGRSMQHLELPATVLAELRQVFRAEPMSAAVAEVPGLARELNWQLGTGTDYATLTEGYLTEVAEWLSYALGESVWDYAEHGDAWEY